ncbi:Spermidine N(1)-acetyltransferase [subsurface metagenome]
MIAGKKTRLRALEKSDLAKVWEWLNDEEVMWFWAAPGNTQSLPEVEQWFTRLQEVADHPSKQFIIENEEGTPIGQIFYEHLDTKHQRTEVGILIGEKEYWGKGYGTDAMIAFLDYLFNELGLHRVYLHLQSYNTRALKSYEKCGFIQEGILRHHSFTRGEYYDDLIMGILRTEFNQRHGKDVTASEGGGE